MPDPKLYTFTFQEVAAQLAKEAGVTEGYWGISIKFGLQGVNIGPSDELRPAAIVPVMEIGLQQFERPNNLSVDAGELKAKKKTD